jgi:hypothetical protein
VFALDLMSTYEGEHTIFGLLGESVLNGTLTQTSVGDILPGSRRLT